MQRSIPHVLPYHTTFVKGVKSFTEVLAFCRNCIQNCCSHSQTIINKDNALECAKGKRAVLTTALSLFNTLLITTPTGYVAKVVKVYNYHTINYKTN